jgi:hypothetical protein
MSWTMLISVTFTICVVSYRYPIIEIIYPRVLQWILVNNCNVYAPLASDPHTIRVVRLEAGSNSLQQMTGKLGGKAVTNIRNGGAYAERL